ncbi:MAG: hypothetical protein QJR02_07285 [Sinobacteraceae bacterium]|nr:hypothetical protein [Nevskiaceae bacterium]
MFSIDASGLRALTARFGSLSSRELSRATQTAVRNSAYAARAALSDEIVHVFDSPTPLTQKSVLVKSLYDRGGPTPAYSYVVYVRDDIGHGTPPDVYLHPEIFGGARVIKPFERRLQRQGLLPQGMYAVPGARAPLDRYGNITGGKIEQILSAVGAAEQFAGFQGNRTAKSAKRLGRKRIDYFVGSPGAVNRTALANGAKVLGIWQRVGSNSLRPILIFVRPPSYSRRLDFFGVANRAISLAWPAQFRDALRRELDATAKS